MSGFIATTDGKKWWAQKWLLCFVTDASLAAIPPEIRISKPYCAMDLIEYLRMQSHVFQLVDLGELTPQDFNIFAHATKLQYKSWVEERGLENMPEDQQMPFDEGIRERWQELIDLLEADPQRNSDKSSP